jgi:hypothetical protein
MAIQHADGRPIQRVANCTAQASTGRQHRDLLELIPTFVCYLDSWYHCRFIAAQDLFRGTIDSATVHPREVVKEALKHNAGKVILAHVHPSGVAEPSKADDTSPNARNKR